MAKKERDLHLFEEECKSEQKPEDKKQEDGWNGWEEEAEKIESGEKANETMFRIDRLVMGGAGEEGAVWRKMRRRSDFWCCKLEEKC